MLAGVLFHYSRIMCHPTTSLFMNKDNAAKQKTMTVVSVKSNMVGTYPTVQLDGGDLRRNDEVRGKDDLRNAVCVYFC